MTPASCAPEETAARFQNSSPPAAPRGGGKPPPAQAPPGPQSGSPSPAPPPCTPRFLLDTSPRFQSNSLGWHRAGPRDKKHGAGDNARTCGAARFSAPARTRSARGDPEGSQDRPPGAGGPLRPASSPRPPSGRLRNKHAAAWPWAAGVWEGGAGVGVGGKGRPPLKRQAPQVAPVGTRTNSRPRGRQGGEKGKEATGAEKRLCVRPACGAPETCAPGEARKARRPRGAESGHRGHSNRNRGAKLASLTSKWGEGGVTGARGARTRVSWLCSPAGSETRRRPRGLEVRRRPLFRTVAVT